MRELWEHMLLSYNLPFTILLALVLLYWLLCLFGLFGVDMLDDMFDGDAGADGGDAGTGTSGGGVLHSGLRFLNAHDVPLMLVLSVLALLLWLGNIVVNYFFNPAHSELLAAVFIVPVLIVALIATRYATAPLAPLMRKLKAHSVTHIPLTGREGVVRTGDLTQAFGQVELDGEGSYLINAKLALGQAPLSRGARVLVVSEADDKGLYTVTPVEPVASAHPNA